MSAPVSIIPVQLSEVGWLIPGGHVPVVPWRIDRYDRLCRRCGCDEGFVRPPLADNLVQVHNLCSDPEGTPYHVAIWSGTLRLDACQNHLTIGLGGLPILLGMVDYMSDSPLAWPTPPKLLERPKRPE
jgi:hypothetical protein